jgi:hypothetical protein
VESNRTQGAPFNELRDLVAMARSLLDESED